MKSLFMLLFLPLVTFGQVPVSEARKLKSGKSVMVTGIVTAVLDDLAFMQDYSGGIALYKAKVHRNDSIIITGKLSRYNSMVEIIADTVEIIGQRLPVVPKIVRSLTDHEGELVSVDHVRLNDAGPFFYPKRAGTGIRDKDTIHYWIDESTDVAGYAIPGLTTLTGVVGRFGRILQLLPRDHHDIEGTDIQFPSSSEKFRIVNWNVEFFGAPRYGPFNDSIQIDNVAAVLKVTQPDIIALQEVSSDAAFSSLVTKLHGYSGRCSSRYSYSFDPTGDFPPQKLCFLYKTGTVKVIREKVLFEEYFDNNPSNAFSSGRLPYLLGVEVNGRSLNIVNIHAKSGNDVSDWSRRRLDAQLLRDTLDLYPNVILLGDFNDDVDSSITEGYESPYSDLISDARYRCVSIALSEAGWHSTIDYDDMIDHQVLSSSLGSNQVSTNILNVFAIIDHYPTSTSDHVPVISEFDFKKVVTGLSEDQIRGVYPNPTTGEIWFPPSSNITVINSLGDVVLKKDGAHPPISLGECAPGIYLVVLDDQIFRIVRISN